MEKEVLKERLTKLVEIGLSKNKTLDFNDVNDFFAGETLTPEELEFVYTYLERKKIDVLRAATEDMAAEQKARAVYENLIRQATDPEVIQPLLFLRQREVVHYQRFLELLEHYKKLGY